MAIKLAAIVVSLSLLASASARKPAANPRSTRVDAAGEAQSAFFERSDLQATLSLTEAALSSYPSDPELLFLRMQAAALEADSVTALDSALLLCRALGVHPDARGYLAAKEIVDLSANTPSFRQAVPQMERLIAAGSPYAGDLRIALVRAAADGVSHLSLVEAAHNAGLITDWRIAGPFGKYSYANFDRSFAPEVDLLKGEASAQRPVERVRYEDGSLVLPDYFVRRGVYYAAANIYFEQATTRVLRIESSGTLQIFVDGTVFLRKDDRFRAGTDVLTSPIHLSAGSHTVLVKFIPDALPLHVSLLTERTSDEVLAERASAYRASAVESAFINAQLAYRRGDYEQAIALMMSLREEHAFAAGDFLLAQSWSQVAEDSPEEVLYLTSTLKIAPDAAMADFLLAMKADENGRADEAWQRVARVTTAHPRFAPAQRLKAEIARPRNWTVDALAAIEAEIADNPSCDNLLHAIAFYSANQQFERAHALDKSVDGCAPGSTAYANLLSASGKHAEAALAAAKLIEANPFSREARLLLVRELTLTGKNAEAHHAAVELARLAPNSERFRRLVSSPADMLALAEEDDQHDDTFTDSTPFYSPYRRDAIAISHEPTAEKYSGLPAITLVDDKVTQLHPDDSVSVYVHRMVRVLTREGVENFGEVAVSDDAHILELRTLKADGTIAEPEFSQHKNTVSMPALSPGDTIEQEYVTHYPQGGIAEHPKDFAFSFGSFSSPVVQARFVALTPESVPVTTRQLAGASGAKSYLKDGQRVQVWEAQDLSRTTDEPSIPRNETLPTVKVYDIPRDGWLDIRDRYRERLIPATRIGQRTTAAIASLQLSALSAEDKLARIYSFVSEHIRDDRSSLTENNVTSAEDSLRDGEGNRSVTLTALARAAGLSADLLLARDVSTATPVISTNCFTRPLVRVVFPLTGKSMTVDIQAPGMTLGGISPRLDRREALLVPVTAEDATDKPLLSFSNRQTEQSTAAGDLRFNSNGDLEAKVTITLGSWRTAQMRSTLAGTESGDRDEFFRDMANRIFNGAADVRGEARNEHNLAAPLQIVLSCRVAHFIDLSGAQVDITQLVPTLGLRRMYTTAGSRRFPLYVDTPLSELTTFRITLPPGVRLSHRIEAVDLRTSFGRYQVTSREMNGGSFEVTRQFDIPVQVVTPGRYADFAAFASRIDNAEHERFTLTVTGKSGSAAESTGE